MLFYLKNVSFQYLHDFSDLSSSLLLLVETQCFSCCILWPFSGLPYLSGHRNDSTWEIIFKVWLLVKQGVQEIRCYSNNDVIVFYACQSEKHHRINSKCKIQWHQLFLIFLKQFSLKIWFGHFNYWFPDCVYSYIWSI